MQIETNESFGWAKFLMVIVILLVLMSCGTVMALTGRINIGSDPEREAKARLIGEMGVKATEQALRLELERKTQLNELDMQKRERTAEFWKHVRTSVAVIVLTGMVVGMGLGLVGLAGWATWMIKQARMPAIKQVCPGIAIIKDGQTYLVDEYTGARGLLAEPAQSDKLRASVVVEKGKQDERSYLDGPREQASPTTERKIGNYVISTPVRKTADRGSGEPIN